MMLDDTVYAVMLQYDLFFKADKEHILKYNEGKYFLCAIRWSNTSH